MFVEDVPTSIDWYSCNLVEKDRLVLVEHTGEQNCHTGLVPFQVVGDRVVQRTAFAEEEMPCLDKKHRLVVAVVAVAVAAKDPLGFVVVAPPP